jgi:3'-phosphoadenosine 5'-phosphosulfate sulfotransferase (PAPS reductase)/FAD synthetase
MAPTSSVPPDLPAVRARTLAGLRDALSAEDIAGARNCAQRLHAALPVPDRLDDNVVLVAYGGGKDSTYTLAFVRMMQLLLHERHGSTFRLRAATNRHAGMPKAVMDNIDRVYRALCFGEDPACTALLVDDEEVNRSARTSRCCRGCWPAIAWTC